MNDKTEQQQDFERRVQSAARSFDGYDTHMMELVDLVACDLFSGGDPDGYSKADGRKWSDLDDVPIYTRGNTTHPAKLQWRVKADRVISIVFSHTANTPPAGYAALADPLKAN